MAVTLEIRDFSCIKKASFKLSPLTVIIGPQASGKSVISKLTFFFLSLWNDQFSSLEDGDDLEAFRLKIAERFSQTFPLTAWGASKFSISFSAGAWSVTMTRGTKKGAVSDSLKIVFSDFLADHYESLRTRLESMAKKAAPERALVAMEYVWQLRQASEKVMAKELGRDFFPYQLFIPAGRSFFTNAGKAVMLLEQGNMVDPFVARFGRYFANARDRMLTMRSSAVSSTPSGRIFEQLITEILGGSVKRDRASEYLEARDGRKIPFMVMSSGQQELIPLVLALKYWEPFAPRRVGTSLMCIEEPEAHLFPSAQNRLVELLALIVNSDPKHRSSLLITTHSPYVLAKLNNLIRAGALSDMEGISKSSLERVVPKHAWLAPGIVSAFGLEDGVLTDITDQTGLIDGEYLDRVSGEISEEFNKLLGLEFSSSST